MQVSDLILPSTSLTTTHNGKYWSNCLKSGLIMIDDLKESRREKVIVKSVIVLVCVLYR